MTMHEAFTPHRAARCALIAALAAVALGRSAAVAGYHLVDKEGEQTLVSNGRVKEMSEDGSGPQSVFDLRTARAWMSNPERSVYWEGTIDELCTTVRETAVSMARKAHEAMEEQMAKLPLEQRAKVEELRKALAEKRDAAERQNAPSGPGVIRVESTDETATIAGEPTRKFRVLVDGKLYQEDWLTTDPALGREFALDKASALMSRVSACAATADTGAERVKSVDEGKIYRELYAHGWPLRVVSHAGGKAVPRSEVVSVEKRDVADHEFKPPPGYRKAGLAEVMFSAAGGP
jgi:hypothetical protein